MANKAYLILEEIFDNQITVMNIAVPTKAVNIDLASQICGQHSYDTCLVKKPNKEDTYLYIKELNIIRPLKDSEIISESTPIKDVLDALCDKDQLFVKVKRNISHVVTKADLDTIPVRIWLYGMISLFEIELKVVIRQLMIKWESKLPEYRLDQANELFIRKKLKNEEIDLLGCITLQDLELIVLKSWDVMYKYFPSKLTKTFIRSELRTIRQLRNSLAHGQTVQTEWPKIYQLVNLISFVMKKI